MHEWNEVQILVQFYLIITIAENMECLLKFTDKNKISQNTHSDNKYIVFICTFQSRLNSMWIVVTGLIYYFGMTVTVIFTVEFMQSDGEL